jgi:hypothetical protein
MWEHKEVSIGFIVTDSTMTRTLSWRERLTSWPWRPWVKEVPTDWAMMLKMREAAIDDMRSITVISEMLK